MFSSVDVYRPSYFEMIACDRLFPSLTPALAHLGRVVARHTGLTRIVPYGDEIRLAAQCALESHYLHEYDASIGEYFYGLKRVRCTTPVTYVGATTDAVGAIAATSSSTQNIAQSVSSSSPSLTPQQHSSLLYSASSVHSAATNTPPGTTPYFRPLSESDRRRALFFLCILPYLKSKLDALYVRWRDGVDEEGYELSANAQQLPPLLSSLRAFFLRVYPYLHFLYCGAEFAHSLSFLFERTVYASPWLNAIGQVVRRMRMDEMNAPGKSEAMGDAAAAIVAGSRSSLSSILHTVQSLFTRYAKYGFLFGLIGFKFLEWWYSPANVHYNSGRRSGAAGGGANAGRKLPVPPPPLAPKPAADVLLSEDMSVCPLCNQERINPAATPTGFVFCYACIHQYLTQHHECPVTKRACEVEEVRKIYEN